MSLLQHILGKSPLVLLNVENLALPSIIGINIDKNGFTNFGSRIFIICIPSRLQNVRLYKVKSLLVFSEVLIFESISPLIA